MPPVTTELPVNGSTVTTFDRFGDSRGYFNELYNVQKYDESLHKEWKQVSFSSSQKHALRGLHCSPHGKFITCVRGAFYDVVACVDTDVPGPLCCAYVPGTRVSLLRAARTERSAQLVSRRGVLHARCVTASSLACVLVSCTACRAHQGGVLHARCTRNSLERAGCQLHRVPCAPQVIADFREDSPTFGRWCGVLLTEHNKKQVYVPPNCGHGFFTLEDNTCALYLQEV